MLLGVEPGVVEGEAGAPTEVGGEIEVVVVEAPAGSAVFNRIDPRLVGFISANTIE